jgi:hypothetical protein
MITTKESQVIRKATSIKLATAAQQVQEAVLPEILVARRLKYNLQFA